MAFSLFESTLLVPKTEFKIDMENFFESRYTNLRIQCEETHHLKEVGVFSTEINNRICDKIPFLKIFLNLEIVKCRKKKFLIIFVKKKYLEIKYRKY